MSVSSDRDSLIVLASKKRPCAGCGNTDGRYGCTTHPVMCRSSFCSTCLESITHCRCPRPAKEKRSYEVRWLRRVAKAAADLVASPWPAGSVEREPLEQELRNVLQEKA